MRPTGLDRRDQLRRAVDAILASERDGALTRTAETSSIDFKEEAGRRNGPNLEPGGTENPIAATKLADEVACMVNSSGGGALILGIEDGTGAVLGTELGTDWLHIGQQNIILRLLLLRLLKSGTKDLSQWRN